MKQVQTIADDLHERGIGLRILTGRLAGTYTPTGEGEFFYDAIDQWAFCSLSASPGARTFYDPRRAAGDLHRQALRALGN